jgi:hypothetical protein
LVGLVSDDRAAYCAGRATDEGAFAGMAGLIADDGSGSRAQRTTYQRAALSPRRTARDANEHRQCNRDNRQSRFHIDLPGVLKLHYFITVWTPVTHPPVWRPPGNARGESQSISYLEPLLDRSHSIGIVKSDT